MNSNYYRMLLEELAYPEWLIQRKANARNRTLLGITVETTDEIDGFEMLNICIR